MLWAYKQVVLPSLCYGCVVFAHTLDEPRLAKLRRLNRLALQLIAPFAPSTPTGGLEVITDTPPHSHRNAEKKHEHHPQDRKAQTNLGWDHVERLTGVLQTLVCPNPRHAKPSATKQVPHPIQLGPRYLGYPTTPSQKGQCGQSESRPLSGRKTLAHMCCPQRTGGLNRHRLCHYKLVWQFPKGGH